MSVVGSIGAGAGGRRAKAAPFGLRDYHVRLNELKAEIMRDYDRLPPEHRTGRLRKHRDMAFDEVQRLADVVLLVGVVEGVAGWAE